MIERSPTVFLADYSGEPGDRTFFIQARGDGVTASFLVEKQQIVALAEQMREMLLLIDPSDPLVAATPARDPDLRLEVPIEPEWRVGTISIGYVEDDDRVVVSLLPAQEEGVEADEDLEVRLFIGRDQARGFVLHALASVSEGRPICQLCGLPIDPEGHNCPASNGHRLA